MEHAALIQDFFDGKIDESMEDDLFQLMSINRDIRREFKNHMTIESALKNDSRKLMPLASTTLGVFSRLGYQSPGKNFPTGESTSAVTAKPGFFARHSNSVYTGIATAIVTSALFLLLMNGSADNASNVPDQARGGNTAPGREMNIPPANINPYKADDRQAKAPVKFVYITRHDTVYASDDISIPAELPAGSALLASHDFSSAANPDFRLSKTGMSQDRNSLINFGGSESDVLNFNGDIEENSGLSVGLTCFQDWALNGPAVREAYMPKFNNWGVSAFYSLSDALSIGLDLRKEFFYQDYKGSDNEGNEFIYRQNTNYISWGLAAKYKFYNFRAFDSFTQLTCGSNLAGPVVRLMTGLDYRPGLNNTFYIGIEGSLLNYYHNDKTFYSPKIGINFGAAFGF